MRRLLPVLLLCLIILAPAAAQGDDFAVYLPALESPPELRLTASYLGGAGGDAVRAADFSRGDELILGGTWPDLAPAGVPTAEILGGGAGALVRLDYTGRRVVGLTRVGGAVWDLEVSAAGPVVACGDFGVALLDPALNSLLWADQPGEARRCAVGAGGTAAALVGSRVHTYSADGARRLSWDLGGSRPADLAVDDGRGLVFVAGYTQKASDLKVAFLRAYSLDGALVWTSYDFTADETKGAGLGADSEGRRVAMGRDGRLYFAGFTDGGNSIYTRDPKGVGRRLGSGELIAFDAYNTPFQMRGAKSLAWYGRFDPASGQLERGQWLLTRLSNGDGNSIGIHAIDAAEDGTLLVAGEAYASMQGRDGMSFAGVTLGGYEGGEPFLLVVSPDFAARRLWTALAAPGTSAGGSPSRAAAIRRGALAVGVTLAPRAADPPRGLLTTPGGLQPAPGSTGADEAYFLLMPTP